MEKSEKKQRCFGSQTINYYVECLRSLIKIKNEFLSYFCKIKKKKNNSFIFSLCPGVHRKVIFLFPLPPTCFRVCVCVWMDGWGLVVENGHEKGLITRRSCSSDS